MKQLAKIVFLVEYALKEFKSLINIREGYFLLRIVVKSIKCMDTQNRLIKIIGEDFLKYALNPNGSLLYQCIIYNFPLEKYEYTKSCSGVVFKEHNSSSNYMKIDYKNTAVIKLISYLFTIINYWDHELIKPIVECSIKVGKIMFENSFMLELNNYIIEEIMKLDFGFEFLKFMLANFNSNTNILNVVKSIRAVIITKSTSNKFSNFWNIFLQKHASKFLPQLKDSEVIDTIIEEDKVNEKILKVEEEKKKGFKTNKVKKRKSNAKNKVKQENKLKEVKEESSSKINEKGYYQYCNKIQTQPQIIFVYPQQYQYYNPYQSLVYGNQYNLLAPELNPVRKSEKNETNLNCSVYDINLSDYSIFDQVKQP